jgi:hypothetical protein
LYEIIAALIVQLVRCHRNVDDSRIERLAQAAYARGHFTLNDLRSGNRAVASDVLGNERVTGKGCQ